MEGAQQHQMQLAQTHPSGAEEWFCPTCGRRFIMQWPPAYSKIVIEPGDEYAMHSGCKGGLSIGYEITECQDTETPPESSPTATDLPAADTADSEDVPLTDELRPWLKWMQDSNLDERWDNAA